MTTAPAEAPDGDRDGLRRVLVDGAPVLAVARGGTLFGVGATLAELLAAGVDHVHTAVDRALDGPPLRGATALLAPVDEQEVWASGVTYRRSASARVEESVAPDAYERVYAAERPELFLKATPRRVPAPGAPLRIRRDSDWDVPEPELALVADAHGAVVGYIVGDDVSSRSIEGANPLYLPQAKIYDDALGLSGTIVLAATWATRCTRAITLRIRRAGATVFEGATSVAEMARSFDVLVEHLFRELSHPRRCPADGHGRRPARRGHAPGRRRRGDRGGGRRPPAPRRLPARLSLSAPRPRPRAAVGAADDGPRPGVEARDRRRAEEAGGRRAGARRRGRGRRGRRRPRRRRPPRTGRCRARRASAGRRAPRRPGRRRRGAGARAARGSAPGRRPRGRDGEHAVDVVLEQHGGERVQRAAAAGRQRVRAGQAAEAVVQDEAALGHEHAGAELVEDADEHRHDEAVAVGGGHAAVWSAAVGSRRSLRARRRRRRAASRAPARRRSRSAGSARARRRA